MRMHSYGTREILLILLREIYSFSFSILCHDIMLKSSQVLTNLWVDAERMMLNIESQNGLVMAEK